MSKLFGRIKDAGRGRWTELLLSAGFLRVQLSGRGQPCPKCGGEDRFNAAKNVDATGAVYCRKCFNGSSNLKPGDGIATVAWMLNLTNGEAAQWLAEQLGVQTHSTQTKASTEPTDVIAAVCHDKRMPVEALRQFGVTEAKRGKSDYPVARVNVYNDAGEVHSYFDLAVGEKGWLKRGKGSSGMFFPSRLPVAGETWLLVEGVKDAAALIGLGFNAAGMPTSRLNASFARLFAGVNVIIVHDLDTAGITGADFSASNLLGIAKSVKVARLSGAIKETSGDDVRDVLLRTDGEASLRQSILDAVDWEPRLEGDESDDRPQVLVTLDESKVTRSVLYWLGQLGWNSPWIRPELREELRLYVRGGVLTQVHRSEEVDSNGQLRMRSVPRAVIRERVTQACCLYKEQEQNGNIEMILMRPPSWLLESIYQRGNYGGSMRPLAGIVQSPTLRLDGSIVQLPGYDNQTGLIYQPIGQFPKIPDQPTREDALKAAEELLEVLADFPMRDDTDRSAWLAMVLSMIGRTCIDGYVPLFAVTANVRGAGKSLLVDAATLIAYGQRAGRQAFTRDEDEMRKIITSVGLAGIPCVLFDNLDTQLGGAALDAAITSSIWSDRILGQSKMTEDMPLKTIWAATGNNMTFGTDVGRRVLPIRLQSQLEQPEDRSGFKHPDLLAWVSEFRPRLAAAALTILRAYFVAGCPKQCGGDWGSFEPWSAVIRGSLVWAGQADPLLTRKLAQESDDTISLLGKLITGLEAVDQSEFGVTSRDIGQLGLEFKQDQTGLEALAEAVAEICGGRFNAQRFGNQVRSLKGRVWQGRYIDSETAHGGVARWVIKRVNGGDGWGGGSDSPAIQKVISSSTDDTITNIDGDLSRLEKTNSDRGEISPPCPPVPPDCDNGQIDYLES